MNGDRYKGPAIWQGRVQILYKVKYEVKRNQRNTKQKCIIREEVVKMLKNRRIVQ